MSSSDARPDVGMRAVTAAVWADRVGNATVYWTAARPAGRSWRSRSETVVACGAGFRDAAQPASESPAKTHANVREMTGIVDTLSCRRRSRGGELRERRLTQVMAVAGPHQRARRSLRERLARDVEPPSLSRPQ